MGRLQGLKIFYNVIPGGGEGVKVNLASECLYTLKNKVSSFQQREGEGSRKLSKHICHFISAEEGVMLGNFFKQQTMEMNRIYSEMKILCSSSPKYKYECFSWYTTLTYIESLTLQRKKNVLLI